MASSPSPPSRPPFPLPPLSREKTRLLRSLLDRRLRKRRGLVLVEGERTLAEAAGRGLLRLLAARGEGTRRDRELARRWGVELFSADEKLWGEVSSVVSSPGLLGVAEPPAPPSLAALASCPPPCRLLYLDGVQDPGNVGALIRSAWALGFAAALAGPGTSDPGNPKAVRASAGGVFHLPVLPVGGEADILPLLESGFTLYLADAGGEPWDRVAPSPRALLALGNEGGGLSASLRSLPSAPLSVPMPGGAESLNVLAAGSILMAALSRTL